MAIEADVASPGASAFGAGAFGVSEFGVSEFGAGEFGACVIGAWATDVAAAIRVAVGGFWIATIG